MKRIFLVLLLAGVLIGPAHAGGKNPVPFIPIVHSVVQDTNRWEVWQNNIGQFADPRVHGCGAFWPKHSGHNYIYGAGLWLGALDTTDRDTVVLRGFVGSGSTDWGPCLPNGDTTGALTDSLARVYRSDIPRDTTQWPERDSLGRAVIRSDRELWAICSGLNPYYPDSAWPRVGVVSVRRSLAWNSPGPWGDIVKMEFEVKNVTGRYQPPARTLKKMILGLFVDGDIGNESGTAANDQYYLDHPTGSMLPNLAVQYQTAPEGGWGPPPYYFGLKFVDGPVNNTGDTIRIRSGSLPQYNHDIPPGQPLGLTALKLFTLSNGASTPGQCYLELAGYYYLNPVYNAYDNDFPGPSDHRYLFSCGPFNLPNDSTVRVTVHLIGGTDSLDILHKAELLGVESPPGPVAQKPSAVMLYPCVPNPSSGSCLIRYFLPKPTPVTLRVYDVSGRLVRELEKGLRSAGANSVRWDGRDEFGKSLANGVYLYRLEVSDKSWVKKTVLFR